MTIQLYHGDCLEIMPTLEENSVDAIVCDPPYGLSFMGKDWDHGVPGVHFWSEALRVAKPGAHLLAFGGTRTFHRLACAIEDAGWEIRDTLIWCYGSGFPKSLDVSKALDKAAGAEREVVGHNGNGRPNRAGKHSNALAQAQTIGGTITAPATPDAAHWAGWGTALKPAWEPIIMARKPFKGTVAANVLAWGTGAINVDACRVGMNGSDYSEMVGRSGGHSAYGPNDTNSAYGHGLGRPVGEVWQPSPAGRWPPNLLHDGSDEVTACFPVLGKASNPKGSVSWSKGNGTTGNEGWQRLAHASYQPTDSNGFGDTGSAARFFPALGYDEDDATRLMYCAKASRSDRESGLDSIEIVMLQYVAWENEVQQVKLRVDTEQSPPRVIAASGIVGGIEWNTLLSGKPITALFQTATKSITATATSSITASPTLSWLTRWLTNEYMAGVSIETGNGTSRVVSADKSTPLLTITNGGTEFRLGADNAPLTTQWRIKGNAGSPADHPTVKPTALMRWLVRLVTPPGGVVLDPFCGSGSTGKACALEGFGFVGIEQEAEYVEIARRRIEAAQLPLLTET